MTEPVKAVFIGRGMSKKTPGFIDLIKLYFDKDGNQIDPYATGDFVDPTTLPEYDHWEPPWMWPGQVYALPTYDPELAKRVLQSQQFARLDLLDKITAWLDEGIQGNDLWGRVCEEGGMIEAVDLGLDSETPVVFEEPHKG